MIYARARVRGMLEEYMLVHNVDPLEDVPPGSWIFETFHSFGHVEWWLSVVIDEDERNEDELRELCRDVLGIGILAMYPDASIVEPMAMLIHSGRVRVARLRLPSFAWPVTYADESAPEPPPPAQETTPKTWVTIELLDERGAPVPGQRYRIELPDGSTREGTTDSAGRATYEAVDSGRCDFGFLDLDEAAWDGPQAAQAGQRA